MNLKSPHWEAWKPGVPKRVLLSIVGAMWIGVAIMLNAISYSWLKTEKPGRALLAAGMGFVFALLIHRFGLLRVVDKNLARIDAMEGRRCVFSFMSWKSYLLILIMSYMGFLLRHSSVPTVYLAVFYTAMGTALFFSSIRYLRHSLWVTAPLGKKCGRE